MAESSFISSSMGNHFGIFERLDFVLAAFFLRFIWHAFAFNFLFLHTHGLGAAGRNEQFGFGEDWTCSSVASGASSRMRRPSGVTALSASSVTMWPPTSTPVS